MLTMVVTLVAATRAPLATSCVPSEIYSISKKLCVVDSEFISAFEAEINNKPRVRMELNLVFIFLYMILIFEIIHIIRITVSNSLFGLFD